MGIEVADRAVEFAEKFLAVEMAALAVQARGENRQLLAHRGGRGLLAVGAREHRDGFVTPCERADRVDQRNELRAEFARGELFQDQRISEVVQILGRAAEMDHLDRQRRVDIGEAFLDEVFDRLNVVVGLSFERFHAARVGGTEIGVERAQAARHCRVQRRERVDLRIRGEREIPLDFDPHAIADQRGLAEVIAERGRAGAIAAIDRPNRGQRRVALGVIRLV